MKYNYIDLFCGAGGLGEGFNQAGFKSAYHVDLDQWAIQTVMLREIYHLFENKSKFFKILKEIAKLHFQLKSSSMKMIFKIIKKLPRKSLMVILMRTIKI